MDQRMAFVVDWQRDEWTMTELAARYGISRKTGYKWVDRYADDPAQSLADRSRAPRMHGRAMAAEMRAAVLALRRAYPHRGPKKLAALPIGRFDQHLMHQLRDVDGHPHHGWPSCGRSATGHGEQPPLV
jgi:hypothetical protein